MANAISNRLDVSELDYDRDDDWWTDRKGGYDVTYKYDKETK